MNIILLGAPGAGKGSVGKPLSKTMSIPIISTGDIFRQNIKENTPLGVTAKKFIDNGELVPDSLTISIVEDRINRDDCKKGFILDGFPRTVFQAAEFEKILGTQNSAIDLVLNVQLSDDIIISRLSHRRVCRNCGETYNTVSRPTKINSVCDICGGEVVKREDDNEETVKKRLETYYSQTLPLVKYYSEKGLLYNLDNNCSSEEGLKRALEIISDM